MRDFFRNSTRAGRILVAAAAILLGIAVSAFLFATRSIECHMDGLYLLTMLHVEETHFSSSRIFFHSILSVLADSAAALGWRNDQAVIQAHNVVWAVVSLFCLYLSGRKLWHGRAVSLWAASCLLSFNGFLYFATETDSYMASMSCLACAACLLVTGKDSPKRPVMAAAAGFFTLAVSYHQTALLFAPAWVAYGFACGRGAWRRHAEGWIAAAALTSAAYLCAYAQWLALHLHGNPLEYFLGFALWDIDKWGTWQNLFLSRISLFWTAYAWNLASLPLAPTERVFLMVERFSGLAWFAAAAAGGVLAWNAARSVGGAHRAERLLFGLWIVVFCLLFAWWIPNDAGYPMLTLFPLAALAGFAADDALRRLGLRERRLALVFLFIASSMLFVHNVRREVLPRHRNGGHFAQVGKALVKMMPEGSVLITNLWEANAAVHYASLSPSRILPAQTLRMAVFTGKSWPAHGGRLVISADTLYPAFKTPLEFDPIARPEEWRTFLKWAFRLKRMDGRWKHAKVTRVNLYDGRLFYVTGEEEEISGSLEEFIRKLNPAAGD